MLPPAGAMAARAQAKACGYNCCGYRYGCGLGMKWTNPERSGWRPAGTRRSELTPAPMLPASRRPPNPHPHPSPMIHTTRRIAVVAIFAVALGALTQPRSPDAEVLTWADASGKFTLKAKFVG